MSNTFIAKINERELKKNVDKFLLQGLQDETLFGAQVLIKQNGEELYAKDIGYRNAYGEAIKTNTLFRIASMTKPITVIAVMKEIELGHLFLDDEISKFIDGYKQTRIAVVENGRIVSTEPAQKQITIRHLLTHVSGVGNAPFLSAMTEQDNLTLDKAVAFYSKQPIAFEPFTQAAYSPTVSFDLLAKIVEMTSGIPFDEYLKLNVFDKLGMTDTTFSPTDEQWDRVISMHDRTEEQKSTEGETTLGCVFRDVPTTHLLGGAGLISSAKDYSLFAEMLLNKGKNLEGERVVGEEMISLITMPQIPKNIFDEYFSWGLGVRVITADDYVLPKGAYGWSGAFGTHFWVDPKNNVTAVLMRNSLFDGGSNSRFSLNFEKAVMNSFN